MPDEDGYTGPATLIVTEREFEVQVDLRGHFQPIDGRYHWYGRVRVDADLEKLIGGRKQQVTLRTEGAQANGELADPDLWGRYRITGTSTPPFAVPMNLADVEN